MSFATIWRAALLMLLLHGLLTAQEEGRVVVLGVDGFDHALLDAWMEAGHLPHLAALAEEGAFRPVVPPNPAQSPTSWATLMTGEGPGSTGVFGFLRRGVRDGKVIPELALTARGTKRLLPEHLVWYLAGLALVLLLWPVRVWRRGRRQAAFLSAAPAVLVAGLGVLVLTEVPEVVPAPETLIGGKALWSALDEEGVPTRSLFAPLAFPAPDLAHGCLLCGFGVPDMMGTPGSSFVFAEDAPPGGRITQMGGKELPLDPRGATTADGMEGFRLLGPKNPLGEGRLEAAATLHRSAEGVVSVKLGGTEHRLEKGRFSEFLEVKMPFSRVVDPLQALVRYRVLEVDPLRVYQEPLQLDPRHQVPWARISSPATYGSELVERHGFFETLGWASATNPFQDGLIDEEAFLEDVAGIDARREKVLLAELERPGYRLFLGVVYTPDRVAHMFYRDLDPEHPAHDAAEAAARGNVILASYQRVDALVGKMRAKLTAKDRFFLISDHGFASFRRAVNLNRWLAEEGYLVARADGPRNLERDLEGDAFRHIDWSKTKAYHLGLGRIWINLKGREPAGIVAPEEADALTATLQEKLLALRDGDAPVLRSVRRANELYEGPRLPESADLILGFERGYRASWNSCLGGVDEPVLFDNRTRWSGDHCGVDPSLVPGAVFADRPLSDEEFSPLDLLPTLRAALGLAPDDRLKGASRLQP